ncbi:MAG: N-acetylmuramoyl-L-alanine amidase [Endozoicomonas sp.]
MSLSVIQSPSPNCDRREIPVDYLILHYTAVDMQDSLKIFMNPDCAVSAHLLINLDGTVYELVDCLNGTAHRAWHAGVSRWEGHEGLNDSAIGIELVNYNGNVFPFTDAQYETLEKIMSRLKSHYPALQNPERILGHEHIAGFRGKADPGLCFDWERFFNACYPGLGQPVREAVCPEDLQASLMQLKDQEPSDKEGRSRFWQRISSLTETTVRLIEEAKDS